MGRPPVAASNASISAAFASRSPDPLPDRVESLAGARPRQPLVELPTLGLVFFYVVLSLVASAVQEWIASVCAMRSKNLRAGVENLIGNDYAKKVYEHPLIKNLAKRNQLPSYIAPETLSRVLLEVIAREHNGKSYVAHNSDEARAMVGKITEDYPLKDILSALIDDGDDAANALKDRLVGWFDQGMSRVSGWYKRRAKLFIFIIVATVTVATKRQFCPYGRRVVAERRVEGLRSRHRPRRRRERGMCLSSRPATWRAWKRFRLGGANVRAAG